MTVFARPGSAGALMSYESRYDNFIGGQWVAPAKGLYFENPTPVTGQTFCEVARSDADDVGKALDADQMATRDRPMGPRRRGCGAAWRHGRGGVGQQVADGDVPGQNLAGDRATVDALAVVAEGDRLDVRGVPP